MIRTKIFCRWIFLCGFPFLLSGCESVVYWHNLPRPTIPQVVWVEGDTETIKRAVEITRKLVGVKPLSASAIFVMTNEFRFKHEKLPQIPDLAHAGRCWMDGEKRHETRPPSAGCIWIPTVYLIHFSDDGLAGLLAHELGHIEMGHKPWKAGAEPRLIQWEADEAALERLALAGYCAGMVIRKAGSDMVRVLGTDWRHPWQTYSADCKPKSPQP